MSSDLFTRDKCISTYFYLTLQVSTKSLLSLCERDKLNYNARVSKFKRFHTGASSKELDVR